MGTAWTGYGGARAAAGQYQIIEGKEASVVRWGRDPLEGLGGQHDVRTRNDWTGN